MRRDVVVSIICTDNRSDLARCLASLPQACDGLAWEAVVVDNASTDGTAEMVRRDYSWAKLIVNDVRQGFSANHNQVLIPALRERQARYLVILNDDITLDPGALTSLVSAADADSAVGALGPALRGPDGIPQRSFFAFPSLLAELATVLGLPRRSSSLERGWLNGSCILFRAAALECIGALDERFFLFYEDMDITLRLWNVGWRVAVAREATIVHLEHQTVARPAPGSPMAKQMLRSQYLYFRKHKGVLQAVLLTLASRVILAARAGKAGVWGAVTQDADELSTARLLVQLVLYSPRHPLMHESRAKGASVC